MITYFHGVDKHSTHLTITTVNKSGELINCMSRCEDFQSFISTLSEKDAVAIEAGNMTFYLADAMEERGASVFIITPVYSRSLPSPRKRRIRMIPRHWHTV